jgi:hypothetical protein
MRSLRDALAGAPTVILAATLGVIVLGAVLFGFAISELTSDSGDSPRSPQAPTAVGGSSQPGISTDAAVIGSTRDRAEAARLARQARSNGARVKIVRFGDAWVVLSQSSQ